MLWFRTRHNIYVEFPVWINSKRTSLHGNVTASGLRLRAAVIISFSAMALPRSDFLAPFAGQIDVLYVTRHLTIQNSADEKPNGFNKASLILNNADC